MADHFISLELLDQHLRIVLAQFIEIFGVDCVGFAAPEQFLILGVVKVEFCANDRVFSSVRTR
jgi:hypothetical protein